MWGRSIGLIHSNYEIVSKNVEHYTKMNVGRLIYDKICQVFYFIQ